MARENWKYYNVRENNTISANIILTSQILSLQIWCYLSNYNTMFANIILSFCKYNTIFANVTLSRPILDHLTWTRAGLLRLADWCYFSRFAPWFLCKTKGKKDGARASSQWFWRSLFEVKRTNSSCQIKQTH